MTRKVEEVRGLSKAREERIVKLRADYEIDAELLAQLVMQFQRNQNDNLTNYNSQPGKQLRKMELVLRNLRDTELYQTRDTGETRERRCVHFLTDDELEYLGF